jgi:hypothetical protein
MRTKRRGQRFGEFFNQETCASPSAIAQKITGTSWNGPRFFGASPPARRRATMKPPLQKAQRCAIYTRKSTDHNLDLAFIWLDAQREACEAYIKSLANEGWRLVPDRLDDGAFSGAPKANQPGRNVGSLCKFLTLFRAFSLNQIALSASWRQLSGT